MEKAVIDQLEAFCDQNTTGIVTLPSGRKVLVCPEDGLDTLAEALQDDAFGRALEESVQQYLKGEGGAFEL